MIYQSSSSGETKKLGERMARKIAKDKTQKGAKSAFVIALTGDLGSGKTTFVQGFLRGLGIKKRATSPTFIIFRHFALPRSRTSSLLASLKLRRSGRGRRHSLASLRGRSGRFASLYHVDAYRLKKVKDLSVLGFEEILGDPENIVLIEWAEKIKKILPKGAVWLKFLHGKKELDRIILDS